MTGSPGVQRFGWDGGDFGSLSVHPSRTVLQKSLHLKDEISCLSSPFPTPIFLPPLPVLIFFYILAEMCLLDVFALITSSE